MMLLDGMVEVLVLYAGDPGLDSLRGHKICYLGWITGPRPNSSKHSLQSGDLMTPISKVHFFEFLILKREKNTSCIVKAYFTILCQLNLFGD